MKKLTYPIAFVSILLILFTSQSGVGQKLPKVQTASVWAPANIKIDGKATEWNDQFHAHNSGNHLYYTIANDDKNLYLIVRMDDNLGNKKIFKGGLTFTILPANKKADKIAVTYPVISRKKHAEMQDGGDSRLIDSLKAASNSGIMKDYKEVHVTGIPELSNPFLSIYNIEGILVGASLDKNKQYVYELAIPIKYLEATMRNENSIRYNIKLNVLPIDYVKKSGPGIVITAVQFAHTAPSIDDLFNYEDSDFSGAYILALKP